jgi:ribA/ribD-fused uncharacterized protein
MGRANVAGIAPTPRSRKEVSRISRSRCHDPIAHKAVYLDAGFTDPCVSECGTHGTIACPKCLGPRKNWNEVANALRFYKAVGEHSHFSNLHKCRVIIEGREHPSSEHAYQAEKSSKKEISDWIALAPYPRLAAQVAHHLSRYDIKPNWQDIKIEVMRRALRAKFSQNPDLRDRLLSTGDRVLVESSNTDYYWGCGKDGTGNNMLGVLLMEIRQQWRDSAKLTPPGFVSTVAPWPDVHFHRLGDGSVIKCSDPEPIRNEGCLSNAYKPYATLAHAEGICHEGCFDCQAGSPKPALAPKEAPG